MTIHSGTTPPPLPPDNDRVCDHYAVLAFPQEKISHYTTASAHTMYIIIIKYLKKSFSVEIIGEQIRFDRQMLITD